MSTESISQWWDALNGAQQVFWGVSLFFSVLFIFQFVINLIGLGVDLDTDTDVDHSTHIDPGFTWLSVRGIIAFFTFFGWAGVIVLGKGGLLLTALVVGLVSGMLAMALVGYLLYLFGQQTQEGNYHIDEALYQSAEVYLSIPALKSGMGKVMIQLGNGLREVDAVTEGKTLSNGTLVRVIGILDDRVLLVEELREQGTN